ncbi:MAG TPA: hypothetical protein VMT61_11450 [Candidatus Binataceae bacterium]|nr:hypothetical protein [Candidatus Binataceae bacterium]
MLVRRMMQKTWAGLGYGSAVGLLVLTAITIQSKPAMAGDSGSSTLILNRLDQLERQNAELRAEISQLRQTVNNNTQKASEAQASAAQAQAQIVSYKEQKSTSRDVQVGLRTGYSDSPYAMPGGYFYGAYLSDRLLTEEDGVPYGTVTGELMAGAVLGNNAMTNANLAGQLAGTWAKTSLTTVEIQPTLQYHADLKSMGLPQLAMLDPYALAGPGFWISLMSTPVVVKGDVPGAGYKHEDANFEPGGVFGFGTNLKLGKVLESRPIQGVLDRSQVGAEWRYNMLANGEGYNQYTGTVAFGF